MANRYSFLDFPPIIHAFLSVRTIMSQRTLPPTPPFLPLVLFNLSQFARFIAMKNQIAPLGLLS
jgi:hypothetical protein